MARKIRTLFIDDLDGGPAEGAVRFALGGTDYEIDLSARHGDELCAAPGTYAEHARKVGGTSCRAPAADASPAADTVAVRAWARDIGYDIKNRGRVPANPVAKYQAATGTLTGRAAVQGREPHPGQQPDHAQVDRRADQPRGPHSDAQSQAQLGPVAQAERERHHRVKSAL